MRFRTALASVCALSLLVAACGGDDDDTASRDETSERDDSGNGDGGRNDSAGPEVELLSEGSEPRAPLRFRLKKGDRARSAMTMKFAMQQTIGGATAPQANVPATRMVMATNVKDVNDDGEATIDVTIAEADVVETPGLDPAVVTAVRDGLRPFVGYTMTLVLGDRGQVLDTKAPDVEGLPATVGQLVQQLDQQLSTIVTPTPEEPVGPGARWKVTSPFEVSGIELTQTTTVRLARLDGANPVFTLAIEQTAEPGPAEFPGVPASAELEVVSWKVTGTGESRLDLAKALPISASSKAAGDQRLTFVEGGEPSELVQHIEVDMEMVAA